MSFTFADLTPYALLVLAIIFVFKVKWSDLKRETEAKALSLDLRLAVCSTPIVGSSQPPPVYPLNISSIRKSVRRRTLTDEERLSLTSKRELFKPPPLECQVHFQPVKPEPILLRKPAPVHLKQRRLRI